MFRIRFRRWLREKLGAEISAGPKDRGILDEMPWLKTLLPLGSRLSKEGGSQITFQRADQELLFEDFSFREVYLVQADGTILLKTRGIITTGWWGTIRRAESVYQALRRLGENVDKVRYVVVVNSFAFLMLPLPPPPVTITIHLFPKNEPGATFIARLVEERRLASERNDREAAEKRSRDYEEGRAAASEFSVEM